MPPSSHLSHSFSLKHFVLSIEIDSCMPAKQQSLWVSGTTGSYGGGWRNVEFKYGWCHCIKPVTANQLCAWKERERHAGNRHICADIFRGMSVEKEALLLQSSNYTHQPFISPSRYLLYRKLFTVQVFFSLTCSSGHQHILCCGCLYNGVPARLLNLFLRDS